MNEDETARCIGDNDRATINNQWDGDASNHGKASARDKDRFPDNNNDNLGMFNN
jgi:hypothetical protein